MAKIVRVGPQALVKMRRYFERHPRSSFMRDVLEIAERRGTLTERQATVVAQMLVKDDPAGSVVELRAEDELQPALQPQAAPAPKPKTPQRNLEAVADMTLTMAKGTGPIATRAFAIAAEGWFTQAVPKPMKQ